MNGILHWNFEMPEVYGLVPATLCSMFPLYLI